MFSRTGGRNIVVMSTSANLTDAAAYNQWNDLLTVQGRQVTYDDYVTVFKQMSRDRQVKPAFTTFDDRNYDGWFFPQMGKLRNHNVIRLLNKVKCKGARGDAGKNGTTVIRVSQAVFNGRPGTRDRRQAQGPQEGRLQHQARLRRAQQQLAQAPRGHPAAGRSSRTPTATASSTATST